MQNFKLYWYVQGFWLNQTTLTFAARRSFYTLAARRGFLIPRLVLIGNPQLLLLQQRYLGSDALNRQVKFTFFIYVAAVKEVFITSLAEPNIVCLIQKNTLMIFSFL